MQEITSEYLASQGLSPTFPKRFFEKVIITESCWIWNAYRLPFGYGLIGRGSLGDGMELAHRASWILHFGPIPEGQDVLHDCPDGDCPYCVNPAHLWLGGDIENVRDMFAKGRARPFGGVFPKGEQHHLAKLTQKQADEIRRIRNLGCSSYKLARMFGVSRTTIRGIVHNIRYLQNIGI